MASTAMFAIAPGTPCFMRFGHLGAGVADINLPTGDVVAPAIQRG